MLLSVALKYHKLTLLGCSEHEINILVENMILGKTFKDRLSCGSINCQATIQGILNQLEVRREEILQHLLSVFKELVAIIVELVDILLVDGYFVTLEHS